MRAFFASALNIIVIILGIFGLLCILYAWSLPPFRSAIMTTDNAYVKGFVTNLAPQVSGLVTEVNLKDFQRVKKGDLLVQIDVRPYQQKLDQAKATLAVKKAALADSYEQEKMAQAQIFSDESALKKAEADWNRVKPLTKQGYQSQSQYDTIKASLDEAQANLDVARQKLQSVLTSRAGQIADVQGAEAAVELAQLDLGYTHIYAPFDGRAGEIGVRLGQYVSPGTQLLALVPDEVWITANYKENQLDNMKIGQPVSFTVDALNHKRMTGYVERFSPAAGTEFAVLKPDNATGNFTKVVQRIPVRIHIDPNQAGLDRLAPGMSVVTSVDTSKPGTEQITDNQPASDKVPGEQF